jgi:phage shock protein C
MVNIFCTACGVKIEEQDRFCRQCGQNLKPGAEPPRPAGEQRRLVRPKSAKKIAGVCAGIARYLEVDPAVVRLIFLAVALTTGVGFIAYIAGWIAMPLVDDTQLPAKADPVEASG